MRSWLVAGAVIEGPDGLLLVANRRRSGEVDWSTPGGVIDGGEAVLDGLGREVAEETGLVVERWAGQLYEVQVEAPDLGWHLRVEVHRAAEVSGELRIDDPDGIVIDAAYLPPAACDRCLVASPTWVREPLAAWIGGALPEASRFGYRVRGSDPATFDVVRLA